MTMIFFFVFAYAWTETVLCGYVILGAVFLGAFILIVANVVAKWVVNLFKI